MGNSVRIRTELGINKTLNVELEQNFNSLEILSLKIQQEDLYNQSCAQYGVVVGRVIANGGYGLPNARVSIFVPITDIDKGNPEIFAIYPYTNPQDRNEDGYRYNLLPYEQSYSNHVPTGTFPSRKDALTNRLAIEIYDKYYKYVVKTNESGDFMIMGVPLGVQTVFMDLDLSDIGEFSLTPQDLVRMGRATEAQVSGRKFKSSTDLNSLPQIVSITKSIDVSPLWGDPSSCQIAVNRVDFDLRDDVNIDIQPTAVFMGSIISSIDTKPLKSSCKPSTEMGNLCNLVAGPGEILCIRQTIYDDAYGRPVLEQYNFDGGNDVIEPDGSWLVDVPMNLDYVTINEFGERIFSNDPKVGIPTKAKYRFKVKWKQANDLSEAIKRGYFLVPNIRENGWATSISDPRLSTGTAYSQFIQSYAFSLDWNDYGDTGSTIGRQIIQSAIDCEDRFYQFSYNKVYTVSGLIDLYHKGTNRGRFIGIKQITDTNCDSTNYKFPTNDGTRNFDIIFNIINILMVLITRILLPLIPVIHIIAFIWPLFKLLFVFVYSVIAWTIYGICIIIDAIPFVSANCVKPLSPGELFNKIGDPFKKLKIPMLTYPECETCDCKSEEIDANQGPAYEFSVRAQENQSISCTIDTQSSAGYSNSLSEQYCNDDPFLGGTNSNACATLLGSCADRSLAIQELMAGNGAKYYFKRTPASLVGNCNGLPYEFHSQDLTLAERMNLFNTKGKFFSTSGTNPGGGVNQIKVSINPTQNVGKFHYDNVMALLIDDGCAETFTTGKILSFNGSTFSTDPNITGSTLTTYLDSNGEEITTNAVKGAPKNLSSITINCANPNDSTGTSFMPPVNYILDQRSEIKKALIPNTRGQILSTNGFTFTDDGNTAIDGVYTNISGVTDGVGVNATFDITVVGGVATIVVLNNVGYNYEENETITILGSKIGGQDGYDDIDVTITNVTPQQFQDAVFQRFPTDVEYFQVITAITYSSFCNLNPTVPQGRYNNPSVPEYYSLRYRFTDNFFTTFAEFPNTNYSLIGGYDYKYYSYSTNNDTYRPIYTMPDQKQFVVAFLVRGVDPNSSRQQMDIDISKLLGKQYGNVVVRGNYKLNIPIQPGLILPRHNLISTNETLSVTRPIFFDSYFYQVPSNFSAYTTNLIANYSSLDATSINTFQVAATNGFTLLDRTKVNTINGTNGYLTVNSSNNLFARSSYYTNGGAYVGGAVVSSAVYDQTLSPNHYLDLGGDKQHRGYYTNEYIEGGTYFYSELYYSRTGYVNYNTTDAIEPRVQAGRFVYFSPVYPTGTTTSFIAGTQKVVMRTDRLPSSTYRRDIQGNNTFVLHQNIGFAVFAYEDDGTVGTQYSEQGVGYNSENNIEDEPSQFEETVLSSFTCQGLAPLNCYSGNGENFGVKPAGDSCYENPSVVRDGCYVFVDVPILRLIKDFKQLAEWKTRFKVNLAACRGVFGHSFVNNWVNGTLFAFPIKNKRLFDNRNKPFNKYCKDVVMLHPTTNNFFYRSSPYNTGSRTFVGFTPNNKTHRNKLQLQFPTTIMDLGPRDEFAYELSCSSDYFGYNINNMKQTSYQDISNILNLFIISRQISSSFLQQLFSAGDASVNTFFSRKKARFDGDYAQAISVNSELGVDEFDFESYDYSSATTVGNTFYVKDKTIGIFFSSDTQNRDYISPKRIIRNDSTVPGLYDNLSVFTQDVPMYKWNISQNNTTSIFGNEYNDWATTKADIQRQKYQLLDRTASSSNYFRGQVNIPYLQKGYIYNVAPATPPSTGFVFEGDRVGGQTLANGGKVTVGAPFYFYFGLVRGNNALDKFNVKYLGVETI